MVHSGKRRKLGRQRGMRAMRECLLAAGVVAGSTQTVVISVPSDNLTVTVYGRGCCHYTQSIKRLQTNTHTHTLASGLYTAKCDVINQSIYCERCPPTTTQNLQHNRLSLGLPRVWLIGIF